MGAAAYGKCDALLVTNLTNVRWLTGLASSNAGVLVTAEEIALATDGRYQQHAANETPDCELIVTRNVAAGLLDWCGRHGVDQVGFESSHVTVSELAIWNPLAASHGIKLIPIDPLIEELREVKDPDETALLDQACEISVAALEVVLPKIFVGMTEVHLARTLELAMADLGADDRAFETIVASGPNSAIPHHAPTIRPIGVGDLLKIDFGAMVGGYHADCTRTFVTGAQPTQWQAEIHSVVAASAQAGRQALVAGVEIAQVDAAARNIVADAGYGDQFIHGLGHGVGLEIHESPLIADSNAGILEAGVVVTIEPGVYLPGIGGVRIEDTCAVGNQAMTVLTPMDRELTRVG